MKVIPCRDCNGTGHISVYDGVAVLAERYPELPIAEMAERGWLGSHRKDDEAAWDKGFLCLFDAADHEEVKRILTGPPPGLVCCVTSDDEGEQA